MLFLQLSMTASGSGSNPASSTGQDVLRFTCGGCQSGLATNVSFAGVEAPCPVCGTPVRAPFDDADYRENLRLVPFGLGGRADGAASSQPGDPVTGPLSGPVAGANQDTNPSPVPSPPPRERVRTREEEETAAAERHRRRSQRLKYFDAALVLLFLGMLALGGAALAFTEPKADALPKGPPELSSLVVERMQQLDRHRDEAIQSARAVLSGLIGVKDAAAASSSFLWGSGKEAGRLVFPLFPEAVPEDFEFIQARRIPGTDRFLAIFEVASDPPLVIPVEETPAGSRVHGDALLQQTGGRLAAFLAAQGSGEQVFYALLRPAPAPMASELIRSRPDLKSLQLVAVEPAFPADGAAGCLAGLAPGSEAAAIFARRAHDSGLRPAVVRLAWRQHRESGNFVELTAFEPNAWSRH